MTGFADESEKHASPVKEKRLDVPQAFIFAVFKTAYQDQ